MNKRMMSIAAAATLALTLAGCSDPGAGTGDEGSAAATQWPSETADLKGTKLTVWAAQNSNATAKGVAAAFEKATGAEIDIVTVPDPYEQSVQTKVASGDKPDLAFWQPTGSQLTALNAKQNLQVLDGAPFIDKYSEDFRDVTGILDGKRYAALVSVPAVEGVWYNKQVFADAGVTETPKNFDELVATAEKIKQAGTTPFFEMGGDKWATQWWVQVQLADAAKDGLWEDVNTKKAAFTDPVILDAITRYQDLVKQGLFNKDYASATFVDQGKAVLAGDAAMAVQVNTFFSQLQSLTDTQELNDKIGFFPISSKGNIGTFIPDQSNALVAFKTGDDTRESAARQFLSYWLGEGYPDFVKQLNTVSIESDVPTPSTVPDALKANADSIGDSVGSMQVLAAANPDLYLNLANMLAGQQTPEQVASTTQAQFEQLAQASGVKGF